MITNMTVQSELLKGFWNKVGWDVIVVFCTHKKLPSKAIFILLFIFLYGSIKKKSKSN